ncbi:hypothetical protein Tco_0154700 [Tanacetum coccineum]
MTTLAEHMIVSGADNRPPMLKKSMYDSWQSLDGVTKPKSYEELSEKEKLQADCDLKATKIVLHGLPPDVYSLINHHEVAKEFRHTDTDVRDDFPTNYNEGDAERLVEHVVPLRPPPRHLLYVCGLTTACRHPKLSYSIKDLTGQVLSMDDFLQLPVWNGTVVSKGDRGEEEKLALSKTQLKCVGEEGSEAPRKKKARKAKDVVASNSKKTTSVHPIRQANLKPLDETITSHLKVRLLASLPPVNILQQKEQVGCGDSQDRVVYSDAHSFHYVHDEENYKDAATRRFVPDWGLYDDLRICHFRACKELVSYLATPAEDEFLSSFSNIEVLRFERLRRLKEAIDPKSKQLMVVDDDEKGTVARGCEVASYECGSYRKSLADGFLLDYA